MIAASNEARARVIDCPRCHQQCGWCADYRWMHGKFYLPGIRKRCSVDLQPEGDACPLCHGTRRVRARTTFQAAGARRG